jgi:hypothetical protein
VQDEKPSPRPGGGFFFANLVRGAPLIICNAAERSYSAQAALCVWNPRVKGPPRLAAFHLDV